MPARKSTPFPTVPRGTPIGKQQTVALSPPAYQVRQAAGLGLPTTTKGWVEGVIPPVGGALVTGVFSQALPSSNRWLGYAITLGLGAVLSVTSAYGTWPESMGAGMVATSLFGFYLLATGQEVTS